MAPLFYEGYDPQWILGRDKGPPVETKPKPPAPAPAPKPPAPPQPIELKVPFCCEECQRNIFNSLIDVEGVESVKIDDTTGKVTVGGKAAKPDQCLKVAKKVHYRADFWPKKKEDAKKDDGKKDDGKKDDKKN